MENISEPMSRFCKVCSLHQTQKKTDPEAYAKWKENHNCKINHHGSTSGMEVTGTKRIFQRSINKNKLQYIELYGDGDSKSYSSVKDVYENITVKQIVLLFHDLTLNAFFSLHGFRKRRPKYLHTGSTNFCEIF